MEAPIRVVLTCCVVAVGEVVLLYFIGRRLKSIGGVLAVLAVLAPAHHYLMRKLLVYPPPLYPALLGFLVGLAIALVIVRRVGRGNRVLDSREEPRGP